MSHYDTSGTSNNGLTFSTCKVCDLCNHYSDGQQTSTKMENFWKGLNYLFLCKVIVLYKWNLDLCFYQELLLLVMKKEHLHLTLQLEHLRVWRT